MGSKRVGLARVEALIEQLKRNLDLSGATITDPVISTKNKVTLADGSTFINDSNGFKHATLDQDDTTEHKVASIDLSDFMTAGNVIRIRVRGVTTAVAGSPTALTLGATFNTSSTHDNSTDVPIVSIDTTAPAVNKAFILEFDLMIHTTGAGGKASGHVRGYESNDGTSELVATSAGAVSVNLNTHQHLHLFSKTAAGDGSNHATTAVSVDFELLGEASS